MFPKTIRGSLPGKRNWTRSALREALEGEDLQDAPVKPMPQRIKPMLATLIKEPFDHPDWIFEVKWDGYRAIAEIRDGDVSLYSRNGISLGKKFSPILEALRKFRFEAVLDGEIVVVDDRGHPDFQMLQDYQKSGSGHLLYYVFDLLYFAGHDLTGLPLVRRKEILKKILPSAPNVKFSDHVAKDGILFFQVVKEKGLEGIVAKHSQSAYRMGRRSRQWLKVKTHLTQEGVIAGFTEPRGRRKHFGALVLGVFQGDELIYIGHTGGGFGAEMLREIREKLDPLIRKKCPFRVEPKTNTPVTWVKPELVCEVMFQGWTDEGIMRQPVFLRLREDKNAREVVREGTRAADPAAAALEDRNMKIHVGTSGYGYKEWKGKFYPEKISPKEMLRFYAERLGTVEINNTFYHMPTESVLSSWAEQVPDDFVFAFKAPQVITHLKRLKNVDEETEYLFGTLSVLEGKLGPVLFQFPKSFHADLPALEPIFSR